MSKSINTRSIILDMLIEINEKKQYSHIVLRNALKKYQYLSHEDRSFISRVALGCVEKKITLDYIIDQFSTVKTNKLKPVIRNIFRMGIYQILFMDGTQDFAACNEAVKLAEERGFRSLKGFVNGVLRNIARNTENIKYPDQTKDPVGYYAVKYSMPEWIVIKWLKEYEESTVIQMFEAQFAKRALTIRCNTDKITPDQLKQSLMDKGVEVVQSSFLPYAMEISGYDYLDGLEEFNQGLFFIQDLSSMLVGHIGNPKPHSSVIDVCGAPGGKSIHVGLLLEGTGHVESRDISEPKVEMIQDNINRLGIKNVRAVKWDARIRDEDSIGKADLVIADLPCSGLGIINKKPDIKYHASLEKITDLVALQREILRVAQEYVRPGGTLMFSTCTVNSSENLENAEWFAKKFPFTMTDFSQLVPDDLASPSTEKGYLELLPGRVAPPESKEKELNFDGFFIAKFVRNANE